MSSMRRTPKCAQAPSGVPPKAIRPSLPITSTRSQVATSAAEHLTSAPDVLADLVRIDTHHQPPGPGSFPAQDRP
jgi:hypothetical protein